MIKDKEPMRASTDTAAINWELSFDAIPALSPLAIELLSLDLNDDDAQEHLVRIVESEPALGARLMGVANSAACGVADMRFTNITAAIHRIGLRRSIQLASALLFGQPIQSKLDACTREAFWLHSLTLAFAAQEIARVKHHPEPHAVYFLGLVHDLGYMVMEMHRPGVLGLIVSRMTSQQISAQKAEVLELGIEHQELSARLLRNWKVPESLVTAIEQHHRLDIDPDSDAAVLFGAEQIARSEAVVAALYAGLEHPFNAMGMDALGIEFFLDQQLSLSGDVVAGIQEKIIQEVENLRASAQSMTTTP